MDNTDSSSDLNLDPNMMTSQGGTPQAATPVVPTTPVLSSVIDITPGAPDQPLIAPPLSHIDQSTTPAPRILDITPSQPQIVTSTPPVFDNAPQPTSIPVMETPVVPETIASQVSETPTPALERSSAGLNIDTSSPLFEDPDKVIIAK